MRGVPMVLKQQVLFEDLKDGYVHSSKGNDAQLHSTRND